MQFDVAGYDGNKFETLYDSIKNKFADLGKKICGKEYDPPRIIFWNLRGNSNTGIHAPVEVNTENVQLLSGFSPSLMKSILDGEEINNEIENVDDNKEVIETEDTNEPDSVLITSVKEKVVPWDNYRKIIDNESFDKIREVIKSLDGNY